MIIRMTLRRLTDKEAARESFIEDINLFILEIDHRLKWPRQRRRWFHAVQALLGRPDLGLDKRTVQERLRHELVLVICKEKAAAFRSRVAKSPRKRYL